MFFLLSLSLILQFHDCSHIFSEYIMGSCLYLVRLVEVTNSVHYELLSTIIISNYAMI